MAATIGLPFSFGAFVKIHPATQILTWCLLAITLQTLNSMALLTIAGLIMMIALSMHGSKFLLLLRRTRWVMLSLLLIYAFSTPGQPLFDLPGSFIPTREGLTDGLLQLMRLLAALASLAILLERLHRQQLISGLHTLFVPLKFLGMSNERLAVRLALTLHYVEVAMLRDTRDWQVTLRGLFEPHEESRKNIELPLYRFGRSDAVLLIMAIIMTGWALR